ncbi:Mg chelatase-like protein [Bifidobacterium dolichotidis]|uniref:Mg chelatase-like protein n=1 Tax=Bifidobacterium dolichotidis TaxID=2306976 RepID=A0A430FSH7_9BIFI|nr:YifB family Mg chelatase-like AAA ATPase [Bifidobacterium dolichotidis]RSX55815.1 Mg chelatase-like protein [Bifidobacterium dolichotidis]
MAIGSTLSVGLVGLKPFLIQIQAFVSQGLPFFSIIGLPDASLAEARERVKAACSAAGFHWPQTRVTVNMSPASLPKHGATHDLAIAASVLAASRAIPSKCLDQTVVVGEVNLDGSVLPVHGILPVLLHARQHGIRMAIVPRANADEAELVPDIDVFYVSHVGELIVLLGGNAVVPDTDVPISATPPPTAAPALDQDVGDMAEVVQQQEAKWALQIAAAGGHHLLMVGPPGTGKTMLASRMPSIMCPLNEEEQFEVASIRSIVGTLQSFGISDVPPFQAPHHTASVASIVGGGAGLAAPGAVTMAHRGVLFLDEAPEFGPRVLQTLREPLESGTVAVSRSRGTTVFPARFQLIMAANPCPCGYGYGSGERCTCRERDRIRYFSRLSGPILDRIDIQVAVLPTGRIDAGSTGSASNMSSKQMRHQVIAARQRARERLKDEGWTCNAQASGSWLHQHTPARTLAIVNRALDAHVMSLRGADRALRLAWTIADLDGVSEPSAEHMHAAIALRTKVT